MSALALLASLSLLSSPPEPSGCAAIEGAEALLADRSTRFVVIGEMHGTEETPAAFADLVCLAAATGRKVVVALEHPTSEQPALDRFLSSDGGPVSVQALTAGPEWRSNFQDGRTSAAGVALLQRLRQMIAEDQIAHVATIMPSGRVPAAEYERMMAANVLHASRGDALVLTLVGNVHAMLVPRSANPQSRYLPIAAHLPKAQTKSLNATGNGGSAWVCTPDCGPHGLGARRTSYARGIKLIGGDGQMYHGYLNLGVPTTASPPAAGSR